MVESTEQDWPTMGLIGVGVLGTAVITGLCTIPNNSPKQILVSPRNQAKATALAEKFDAVTVAKDNQAVVDGS